MYAYMYVWDDVYMCNSAPFKFGYVDYSSHEEAVEMLKQMVTIQGGILKLGMVDYAIEKKEENNLRMFVYCVMSVL